MPLLSRVEDMCFCDCQFCLFVRSCMHACVFQFDFFCVRMELLECAQNWWPVRGKKNFVWLLSFSFVSLCTRPSWLILEALLLWEKFHSICLDFLFKLKKMIELRVYKRGLPFYVLFRRILLLAILWPSFFFCFDFNFYKHDVRNV